LWLVEEFIVRSVSLTAEPVEGVGPDVPTTTPIDHPIDHRKVPIMAVAADDNARFTKYAHPERLVSTDWLAGRQAGGTVGTGGLVVLESDEDVLLYDTGHLPGAVKIDWHTDLNDSVTRDYVNGERFAQVLGERGIGRDTTVVIYGDKSNWLAAYALWVFTLFGHEDVRLLDGGRAKWIAEGREITRDVPRQTFVDYPVGERDDAPIRAFRDDVLAHIGQPMVDVRSPGEFSGELLHMPDYPQEGALRGGHIPGTRSVPWARAAAEDGSFKGRADLEAIYLTEQGLAPSDDVVTYCRIGERSSHTWFVLTHLLGFEHVRNYDGSWTEWGNAVRVPIEVGATEVGATEVGATEVGATEVGATEVGATDVGATEVGAT
jgi:thiosulfate/3-mercaptopyruvate sulfurtransferase